MNSTTINRENSQRTTSNTEALKYCNINSETRNTTLNSATVNRAILNSARSNSKTLNSATLNSASSKNSLWNSEILI